MVDKSDASVGENQPRKNMEQEKIDTGAVKEIGKKAQAKKKSARRSQGPMRILRIEDLSEDEVANIPSDKNKYDYISEESQSPLASDDDGSRHVYP